MEAWALPSRIAADFWFVLTDETFFKDALRNGGFVAAIGFVGTLGVLLGSSIWRKLAARLSRRLSRHSIDVGPWPLELGSVENVQLRCLVVRYGTDAYVERLASDQERYHGRLQNRVLKNRITVRRSREDGIVPWLIFWWKDKVLHYDPVEPGSSHVRGKFLLPVHRRLGTQFKLFFQVRANQSAIDSLAAADIVAGAAKAGVVPAANGASSAPPLKPVTIANHRSRQVAVEAAREIAERLALQYGLSLQDITEVHEYKRLLRFRAPAYRFHLWFCVDTFGKVETVDGITNNMCFPI